MARASLGYTLSAEELAPQLLVENARKAEEAGFDFLSISDHYFPWVDAQGQSPFVWSVLGAISGVTSEVSVMTGVTCPTMRIHPVILAQASATTATLFQGRFMFGVGTGENLNEHVVGLGWPNINTRLEMLREAVKLIRELWSGKLIDIQGAYFTADQARIYTLPDSPPPVLVAGTGSKSAELAGQIGDGLVSTAPQLDVVKEFADSGGEGKPVFGQVTVCYDTDEQRAKETAAEFWPNAAISGQASQELPMPLHFEQLSKDVTPDKMAEQVVCGPDKEAHKQQIQQYIDAGFTHIYIHQIGPNQDAFMQFYQKEIFPEFK